MVGLLVILVNVPNLHGAGCVGHHNEFDQAAAGDPAAAKAAREICLHQCPALAACQAWAATLPRRERNGLGVVAGVIPVRKPRPKTSRELPVKAARKPRRATKPARDDRSSQRQKIEALRARRKLTRQ
jgi:hypothetical protein